MAQIRKTLGDDAVIVSTTRDPMGKSVTVTAAAERDDPVEDAPAAAAFKSEMGEPQLNGHGASEESRVFEEIKSILAYHSVPTATGRALLDTAQMINFTPDATFEGIRKTLSKVLEATFQFLPLPHHREGFRILLMGPPGMGKTLTIAKAAAQW